MFGNEFIGESADLVIGRFGHFFGYHCRYAPATSSEVNYSTLFDRSDHIG